MNAMGIIPDRVESVSLRDRTRGRPIDWAAVECDYRSGQFSLRDLAAMHRCSHSTIANHAGSHGWTRNAVGRPSPSGMPGNA